MRSKTKLNLLPSLFFFLSLLAVLPSHAQETASAAREETTTLENIYQERVHSVLDNLMNPSDYTLVISATLRSDDQKLKEYNDAVQKNFLPGLPVADPMGFNDARNILLDLKQKVEIQVILAEGVPVDRDNIVKDILKNKLHLNEESGDTITVVRATKNFTAPETISTKHLPELSAKMIAFWVIICMMLTTAIIFWFQRKKEKQQALEKAELESRIAKEKEDQDLKDEVKRKENEALEVAAIIAPTSDEIREELEKRITAATEELLLLAQQYPGVVSLAAQHFVNQGHVSQTVTFLEAIGWNKSKKIFKDLDGRFWGKIGESLRNREQDPELQQVYDAVHNFHRFALSFVLERTANEEGNPFNFIFKLTPDQRIDLLTHEKAENIALIGVYCSGTQMGELLEGLAPEIQHNVLLNLTQIKQLPEAEVKEGVEKFLSRLELIKAAPSIYADGPGLAADFLRSLPPARDEELVNYLMLEHPTEADKLRKVRVMFQDVLQYPNEIIRKVTESLDSDDIQKALVGYDPEFVESFLTLLPTKKALMIQNDLFHMATLPPLSQCAESRRKICKKIEAEFEQQNFKLDEYWKETTQTTGEPESGAAKEELNDDEKTSEFVSLAPDEDDQDQAA